MGIQPTNFVEERELVLITTAVSCAAMYSSRKYYFLSKLVFFISKLLCAIHPYIRTSVLFETLSHMLHVLSHSGTLYSNSIIPELEFG